MTLGSSSTTQALPESEDPGCAAVESLVLDGCHALEQYLDHRCQSHAEEIEQVRAALLAAAAGADPVRCEDALGMAAILEGALADELAELGSYPVERGAA